MKALIIGATGLVGSKLLRILKEDSYYESITAYGRNLSAIEDLSDKNIFIKPYTIAQDINFSQFDHVYCCVGTTIKKAGSKDNFQSVDLKIPYEVAKHCEKQSIKKLVIISALGSNSNSRIFYNRVKGQMEESCSAAFPKVNFVRPSLLLGERDEGRIAEGLGQFLMPLLNPLMQGPIKKFRAIDARDVARAMFENAKYGKTHTDIEYI